MSYHGPWVCYKCGATYKYRPPICTCGYYLFFQMREGVSTGTSDQDMWLHKESTTGGGQQ